LIDVIPYQRKLELANEWVCHKIDGTLPLIGASGRGIFIDMDAIPKNKMSWDEIVRIYDQTGVMFFDSNPDRMNMHPVSFEEYCEHYELFSVNLK
jgi:hypothetical protein